MECLGMYECTRTTLEYGMEERWNRSRVRWKIVHTDSSGVPFFRDRGKLLDINPMGQKNCFRMMRRRTKTRTQSRQAVKYNCFNEIHVLDLVAGLHRDSGTRAQ